MQKLHIRSVFVFVLWLVVTSIGLIGSTFGAQQAQGPKSLDYQNVQKATVRLAHDNAQLWHINGQPVMKQKTVSDSMLILDVTDYRAVNAHLSQATRHSVRAVSSTIIKNMRSEFQMIAYMGQESVHKTVIQIIIDPKKHSLDIQSRRGVRSAWRHSSSVVSLIHSALLKEEIVSV